MKIKSEYKRYFADCYVLTNNRTKDMVNEFLDTFMPCREESAIEYEIPQYQDNANLTLNTDTELIDYVVKDKKVPYSIYWRNTDMSDLRHLMCFFTDDEELILGLSTETKFPNTEIEDYFFKRLSEFAKSDIGLITYEEPAPDNAKKFIEKVLNN